MFKFGLHLLLRICFCLILATIFNDCESQEQQQQDNLALKTEPIHLDLYHKFDLNQDFKPRGSVLVKPRTEYKVAQATFLNQPELSESDLDALKSSAKRAEGIYYLKAVSRKKNGDQVIPVKTTQTLVKSCSLYTSNLADFIIVNLSPLNDFININIFTTDPECAGEVPEILSSQFNTTVFVESGAVGPVPDTATYIKRLEEERQNKLREGKEDNRSFLAKYWIYIVPAIIILMVFSGPAEQGGR